MSATTHIAVSGASAEVEFTETEVPHALYRLYDAESSLLYVGITWNLPQRMEHHAAVKDWWPLVTRRTMVWYASEMDARKAEAEAIDIEEPLHNQMKPAVGASAPAHGQRKGWHRGGFIGWHAPADKAARLAAVIEKRGTSRTAALNEMLAWHLLDRAEGADRDELLEVMRLNGIAVPTDTDVLNEALSGFLDQHAPETTEEQQWKA